MDHTEYSVDIRLHPITDLSLSDACIALCPENGEKLQAIYADLYLQYADYFASLQARGALHGKPGEVHVCGPVGVSHQELLLPLLPEKEESLDLLSFSKIVRCVLQKAKRLGMARVVSLLCETAPTEKSWYWKIRCEVEALRYELYELPAFKSRNTKEKPPVEWIIAIPTSEDRAALEKALYEAESISKGIARTRYVGDLPANLCSPEYLGRVASDLVDQHPTKNVTVTCLGRSALASAQMNAYLAVAQGSEREPCLAIIEYKGAAAEEAPYVFIGKGLTFDSGGISIKPSAHMEEMKYDMSGAGAVYGLLSSVLELNLPINVVGLMAMCENMPSGTATRPGDVVRTASGLSVEIINTDAEGRLVLADTLTYAAKFQPKVVIDIATLTGACVVALSHHFSALLATDEALAKELLDAGKRSGDRAWQLPMDRLYMEQIRSGIADLSNTGTKGGGTITAAAFLSRFAEGYRWAHLDVAGTASTRGSKGGAFATGRPVGLLVQYLLDQLASCP